ncbi:MAG: twin-arginine translocase subunit TatC [bacterium]
MAASNNKKNRTGTSETSEQETSNTSNEEERPVFEGLRDVVSRNRKWIIRTVVVYVAISIIAFAFFSDYLMIAVNWPFNQTGLKLNVFRLVDGLYIKLKAAFIFGLIVILPVLVFALRKLILSVAGDRHRMFINFSIVLALLLFYTGAVLSYFAVPLATKVLIGFTPEDMLSTINGSKYLGFIIMFCLSMGLIFEMPVAILILSKTGIVTPQFLTSKRKYAIIIIWIASAVITPTSDPLSLAIVAVPLMLLYELSIILAKIITARKRKAHQ